MGRVAALAAAALTLCASGARGFTASTPAPAWHSPRPLLTARSLGYAPVLCQLDSDSGQASMVEAPARQMERATPLPQFRWLTVLYLAANPLVLLPFAAFLAHLLRVPWFGPSFAISRTAAALGTVLGLLWVAVGLLPLDRLFPSLKEVTEASKTICLYAVGGRLVPLRALAAATIISASAAICEELAFRGMLQTGLVSAFGRALPATAVQPCALAVQAVIFGAVHSYTSSPAYFVVASVSALALGSSFAVSGNMAVPVAMHFVIDFVTLLATHVQVARSGESAQRELVESAAPIARTLRSVLLGPPEKAAWQERPARGS